MTNTAFLVASIALFVASGIGIWAWVAITDLTDDLRAFDSVRGLQFRL